MSIPDARSSSPHRGAARTFLYLLLTLAIGVVCRAPLAWPAAAPESPASSAVCDRACLNGFVDQYLKALVAHQPRRLPTSADVKFTQNQIPLGLGDGVWKTATSVGTYRIYAADPRAGEAGFIGVIWEGDKPSMFALRLKVVHRLITEVETVVPGDTVRASNLGPFIEAPAKLKKARAAFSIALAPPGRSPRAKMITAARAYYEGVNRSDGNIVPFAHDCQRVENGVALVNNPDFSYPVMSPLGRRLPNFSAMRCREQFNSHFWETDSVSDVRTPLVDEERGIVFAFSLYHQYSKKPCANVVGYGPVCPIKKTAPFTLALVEAFHIRSGEIHEMESVWSVMPSNPLRGAWCGKNSGSANRPLEQ